MANPPAHIMQNEITITLDIETQSPPPEMMRIEQEWAKTGNLKDPKKIAAKQASVKGGLTDSASIFCIGFLIGVAESKQMISLSTASLSEVERANLASVGIIAQTFAEEADMLRAFCGLLEMFPTTTRIITHNGEHFDIPKLRFRLAFHGLHIPDALFTWRHTDTMQRFRSFSISDKQFFKLDEIAQKFGITFIKAIPGDKIDEYIDTGKHADILLYNAMDCLVTRQIALKMLT